MDGQRVVGRAVGGRDRHRRQWRSSPTGRPRSSPADPRPRALARAAAPDRRLRVSRGRAPRRRPRSRRRAAATASARAWHRGLDRPQGRSGAAAMRSAGPGPRPAARRRARAAGDPAGDGLLGRQPRAREQHLGRPLPAHGGGEQAAARRLRRHAHLGERRAEPGARPPARGRSGGHREADADRRPVDGGDQRLVEGLERRQQDGEAGLHRFPAAAGHLVEVLAGGEGRAGAGHHERPSRRRRPGRRRARRRWPGRRRCRRRCAAGRCSVTARTPGCRGGRRSGPQHLTCRQVRCLAARAAESWTVTRSR